MELGGDLSRGSDDDDTILHMLRDRTDAGRREREAGTWEGLVQDGRNFDATEPAAQLSYQHSSSHIH